MKNVALKIVGLCGRKYPLTSYDLLSFFGDGGRAIAFKYKAGTSVKQTSTCLTATLTGGHDTINRDHKGLQHVPAVHGRGGLGADDWELVSALSFLPHVVSTAATPSSIMAAVMVAAGARGNGGGGGGGGGGSGGGQRGSSPVPSRPQGDLRLLVVPDSGSNPYL